MRSLFVSCLFLFILFSCESNHLPISPIDYFDGIESAKTELVCTLDSFGIYNPNSLVCIGDLFFMQGDGLEVLLKLNTIKLTKELIAEKGNGPDELLNITNLSSAGESIVLAECNKKKLVELDVTGHNTVMKITDLPHEYGAFTSVVKSGNLLVATGLFEQGRYLCYNLTDKSVSFTGYYPSEKGNNRKTDNIRSGNIFLSSKLVISPDLGRFACAHYNSGILDINKISNDSIINVRLLDFHYPEAVSRGSGNNIQVAIKSENINGFYDVAASDKYIYTIYSGKTYKEAGAEI